MARARPAPIGKFVGRAEYVGRFKARVEHFHFFIYEGISGIGKRTLMLRLAALAKSVGTTNVVYLNLWPSESILSILGRVEARFARRGGPGDRQGDPYARLTDLLDAHRTVLVLDRFHHLRREDVGQLCRVFTKPGRFRVLAGCQGDPELSALDRSTLHLERLGPLSVDEVTGLLAQYKISEATRQFLLDDARRGGCTCHPLTLAYLLAVFGEDLPGPDFFAKQTARSTNAFKALWAEGGPRLDHDMRRALANLIKVQMPLTRAVAVKAFGSGVDNLLKRGLVDIVDGEVHVHNLVAQTVGDGEAEISAAAAKTVAKHMKVEAERLGEPMLMARAGQLLAMAGAKEDAVDVLASGWETIRDLGFLEAYIKIVSTIEATGVLEPRLRLLLARARMRKGDPSWVRPEMEGLAEERDGWTKSRALVSLTHIYSVAGEHNRVVDAFEQLRRMNIEKRFLLQAGTIAASSMARVGQVSEAEKLSRLLLGKLKEDEDSSRQGELHRLLARVFAQMGRLEEAVDEGLAAATAFERAGDLYHAATAHGFVGDLYRESGDFELARGAFKRFHDLALLWGDRDLIQIAELAGAWVALDVGDLTYAATLVAKVEHDMSAAPSRRLRRYLAAARALLEAGRGHHKEAASQLTRVVEAWETAGQRAIADVLRAQLVRSLIASGELDQAESMVQRTLKRLDSKTAAPRVATFLRESALIHLRRREVGAAMDELGQARKLFAQGGNRREEALTLHRIAHAALDEGDVELARARAKEALTLARSIKHQRAVALARELQGRVALANDEVGDAISALKEAGASLRRLGDETGALHVSEWLLRAEIFAGDLAAAIRQGPKVRSQAERLGIDDLRLRATALSGVAFLRRARLDAASRCFKELTAADASPLTVAMMWRLGEGLAAVEKDRDLAQARRGKWVEALRPLPEQRRAAALHTLTQMLVPPRDRCRVRTPKGETRLGTEELALLDSEGVALFVDAQNGRALTDGETIALSGEQGDLLAALLSFAPGLADTAVITRAFFGDEPGDKAPAQLAALLKDLKKAMRKVEGFDVEVTPKGIKITSPRTYTYIIPTYMTEASLLPRQRRIMKLLGRRGSAPLQLVQEAFKLTRAGARREVADLVKKKLVETVRDGRGQAFRLA